MNYASRERPTHWIALDGDAPLGPLMPFCPYCARRVITPPCRSTRFSPTPYAYCRFNVRLIAWVPFNCVMTDASSFNFFLAPGSRSSSSSPASSSCRS